jgi:hypothetical protein
MPDLPTRQIMLFVCEALRTNTIYLTGLHRNVAALYDALLKDHPELEKTYQEEMEKMRDFPSSEGLLTNIDALIRRLAYPPE